MRSVSPKRAPTASTAGCCAVRHAVQLGVENTTRDGRPSGDSPSAFHRPRSRPTLRPSTRRPDQARTAKTAATTTSAIARMIRERSIIGSDPPKDAALVELGAEEAEGAEVEPGVEGHHHGDRDRDHPGEQRVERHEKGGEQPEGATHYACDASRLMVLVHIVALEDPGRFEDSPGQLPDHVGRPPEPSGEHDRAGDRQQNGPRDSTEDEAGQDQHDHGPLVRLARRPVVEGQVAGVGAHKLTGAIYKLNNLRWSVYGPACRLVKREFESVR